MSEEDGVGLILFPGDGDVSSPDVGWSCAHFNGFRRQLAQAEGFTLDEMWGFGGERPWNGASTALEPLLDHPDVGGDALSVAECAAILPRLEAITGQWQKQSDDMYLQQYIDDAVQLAVVLRFCVEKGVELLFL
ncbi:hypothetical protein ACFC0C_38045 [Streptomyces sp. NPDC056178]|uniref:hypothetical protein n=1 Tax=Streptomyces sp. NPDC056178 TaxID=3345735 RepID=UPI0035E200F8